MSKVKTNPSAIKDYITAIKHSELSDSKKDGIIRVLQQYSWDKQEDVWTDGLVCQKLFDIQMELLYGHDGLSNEEIAAKLNTIIKNIDRRKYWNGEEFTTDETIR